MAKSSKVGVHGTQAETQPANGTAVPRKSRECAASREQFNDSAKPMQIVIQTPAGPVQLIAVPKQFQTGSFGWNSTGKMVVEIDGVPVTVQVGINLTVIGSKEV